MLPGIVLTLVPTTFTLRAMDSVTQPVDAAAPARQLARVVREALADAYARPVVVESRAGDVAVLGGRPLGLAREAAERALGAAAAARVTALDVSMLPWFEVPQDGLRLWRQHGRSGAAGELVTELEAGDPPFQVVTTDEGWQLLRLADGAQGWIPARALVPIDGDREPTPARPALDRDAFVRTLLEFAGAPYVWGGTRAQGVDCSGLVQRAAWRAGGPWLPRHSRDLLRVGARVAPSDTEAGDILVLRRDPRSYAAEQRAQLEAAAAAERRTGAVPERGPAVHPMHVAVALSPTETLHASRDTMCVTREPLESLRRRYRVLGVRRLWAEPGT